MWERSIASLPIATTIIHLVGFRALGRNWDCCIVRERLVNGWPGESVFLATLPIYWEELFARAVLSKYLLRHSEHRFTRGCTIVNVARRRLLVGRARQFVTLACGRSRAVRREVVRVEGAFVGPRDDRRMISIISYISRASRKDSLMTTIGGRPAMKTTLFLGNLRICDDNVLQNIVCTMSIATSLKLS